MNDRYCCDKFAKDRADMLANISTNKKTNEWFYYYKIIDNENNLYFTNIRFCLHCGAEIRPIQKDIDKLKQKLKEANIE